MRAQKAVHGIRVLTALLGPYGLIGTAAALGIFFLCCCLRACRPRRRQAVVTGSSSSAYGSSGTHDDRIELYTSGHEIPLPPKRGEEVHPPQNLRKKSSLIKAVTRAASDILARKDMSADQKEERWLELEPVILNRETNHSGICERSSRYT